MGDSMKSKNAIFHDWHFINFEHWHTTLQLEGKMLPGSWKKETTIYLHRFPKFPVEYRIPVQSILCLNNNSVFAILNASIISKKFKSEVFSFKELSPNKELHLEFNKEGSYDLIYSFPDNQRIEKRKIKVAPQPSDPSQGPHNFDA